MGISTYIFLGPYIECEYRVTKREVQVQACTNAKCEKHKKRTQEFGPPSDAKKKARFCPLCGTAIGSCPLMIEERDEPYEVVGDDLMSLSSQTRQAERVYLAANLNSKHTPRDFSMEDDEAHFDLRALDTKVEMDWLRTKYAKQIEKLRGSFDNVEVRWGFHRYYG